MTTTAAIFEGLNEHPLSFSIIGAAIEVHRNLGPGLLESVYEECLAKEFRSLGIKFERQLELKVHYKGSVLDQGFRLDFLVDNLIVIELKAVEKILPIHEAQLLTYLRLSKKQIGLLINFNSTILKEGIRRLVN